MNSSRQRSTKVRPRARLIVAPLALAACLVAACAGSEHEVTACERLHEHAVELTISAAKPDDASEATKTILAKHAALRRADLGSRPVHCEGLTAEQIECGLGAGSIDEYRACYEGRK